ncbi:hypothetical protein D3C81_1614730 [compost metagenome]
MALELSLVELSFMESVISTSRSVSCRELSLNESSISGPPDQGLANAEAVGKALNAKTAVSAKAEVISLLFTVNPPGW